MKYWEQFAEMLGLDLGERFVLTDSDGVREGEDAYKITENGMYYTNQRLKEWYPELSETPGRILNGFVKVSPTEWAPKPNEKYWYYNLTDRAVYTRYFNSNDFDLYAWNAGNCFETEAEALSKGKEIIEKIKEEYEKL